MLDSNLRAFIRSAVRSVWSLEVLLLLRREAPRAIEADALVLELRGSRTAVAKCLRQLEAAGLIVRAEGACRYAPATPAHAALCDALAQAHAERPVALIDAIVSSPRDSLKDFSDAFRFKEKDE